MKKPEAEAGFRIYERLLQGSRTAPDELYRTYAEPLEAAMRPHFPGLRDPNDVSDAVTDVILAFGERPDKFDPSKGSLWNYLYMAVRRDLINCAQAQARRSHISLEDVAIELPDRNRSIEASLIAVMHPEGLPDHLTLAELQEAVSTAFPDHRDRELLELILDGVRDTGPYAEILRLGSAPAQERAAAVKRKKDALKRRLERTGIRLNDKARTPPQGGRSRSQ